MAHHDDNRPKHLEHHFDTPDQQLQSEKFGMWLFLVTEILLFGGLFCAYAWLRSHRPEMFMYAHQVLDTKMGATNTVVLLLSSFTMAWAVRASQLGQRKLMMGLIAFTFLCGGAFMVIKYIEYQAKFDHGAVFAAAKSYNLDKVDHYLKELQEKKHGGGHDDGHGDDEHGDDAGHSDEAHTSEDHSAEGEESAAVETETVTFEYDAQGLPKPIYDDGVWITESSNTAPAPDGPGGLNFTPGTPMEKSHGVKERPANVHIFFGLYFTMTGLHGIHVLIGMICMLFLLYYGAKGVYTPEYNSPVDMVGLYWHIVDLIWIFLFPLLYLIH